MARLPRLSVPGHLHHVLQRGNNRQPIFVSATDHDLFLALLAENAASFDVAVHAYVLMGNHFHLLATPATGDGVSRLMQAVSRRYVRHFNTTHGRTGTLWEGRYRSTVMDAAAYLLPAMAYVDLNPVRNGLVAAARDFPWSSHGHYAGLRIDRLVTPHPLFWTLGNTPFSREAAYAELVRAGISPSVQQALTDAVLTGWVLGDEKFGASLQKQTERRLTKSSAGRPAKPASEGQ